MKLTFLPDPALGTGMLKPGGWKGDSIDIDGAIASCPVNANDDTRMTRFLLASFTAGSSLL